MTRPKAISLFKAISYVGIYGGLLMPLVFFPFVIFPFVFSKLIFFQVLIGLTFPAYLALAWMEPKYRPPKALLYSALIAYLIALALSTVFSVDPLRSWWGNQERMNGLFTVLHFFAWLTMAVGVLKTWTDWKRLLNYQVGLAVFMAAVALLQIVKKDLLLFPAGERVGGLLDNPIYMGAYQMFNLAFLGLLFLKTNSRTARLWYGLAAIACTASFFATQSRGALVGLAAVVGCFALYYAIFTTNKKMRWGILAAAFLFFASYGGAYAMRDSSFILNNPILSRLTHFNTATQTRFIAWDIAWKGFLERPITGWGFDAFHVLFNEKYNPKSLEFSYYETWFDRAHNTVFDVLAMTGLLGLITFLALFATLFISVWRAQKRGWIDLPLGAILVALPVGYFLQNLFVFDHPAAFSMSYLLFALVIAATRPGFMAGTVGAAPIGAPKATPWTLFAIVQVVMLIIVWRYSALPFQASLLSIKANQIQSTQPDAAWELMKQAGAIPTPYLDEQTFFLSRNAIAYAGSGQYTQMPYWKEMIDHTKRLTGIYLKDHARNTNAIFTYARFLQEVGRVLPASEQAEAIAETERAYRAAIETSPKRQQLYYSFARFYTMLGRTGEAYDLLKQAVAFNPNVGDSWWYAGITAWFNIGNVNEGMDQVLRGYKAPSPYRLANVQEAVYVAQAGAARGDEDALLTLLPQLPTLNGGTRELFLDIARAYEHVGLIEPRNIILNALEQADPGVTPLFLALRNGSATSINASIAAAPPESDSDNK